MQVINRARGSLVLHRLLRPALTHPTPRPIVTTTSPTNNNDDIHTHPTFLDHILRDHASITRLFTAFADAAPDPRAQHSLAMDIIRAISVHGVAEELAIYPMFERCMLGGRGMADKSRKEHGVLKQKLSVMEGLAEGAKELSPLVEEVRLEFNEHIKHEESSEMPKLRDCLSVHDSVALGETFEEARAMAPTRPHPNAPDTGGIAQRLAGLAVKPLDMVRDAMSSR
ncbi:hypothetical protein HDU96_010166 [Phlyctochytrium bullatum]|nr:hypothetical protein HDU96_010166 [Phlyctochytrium bullatum]